MKNIYTLVQKPVEIIENPNPDFTGTENQGSEYPFTEYKGSNINITKINKSKNNQLVKDIRMNK